jgi:hypothetical protein
MKVTACARTRERGERQRAPDPGVGPRDRYGIAAGASATGFRLLASNR